MHRVAGLLKMFVRLLKIGRVNDAPVGVYFIVRFLILKGDVNV